MKRQSASRLRLSALTARSGTGTADNLTAARPVRLDAPHGRMMSFRSYVGDTALNLGMKKPKQTFSHIKALIGRSYDEAYLEPVRSEIDANDNRLDGRQGRKKADTQRERLANARTHGQRGGRGLGEFWVSNFGV